MTEESTGLSRSQIERLADIIMMMQRCFVQHLSEKLSRGQVSFPQFFLLGHIALHDALSMTEVAEKMAHTTAAATGLVDRLENLGYVQRMHDDCDRRRVLVKITSKGTSLVERLRQDIVNGLTLLTGQLTPLEQTTWLQIYEKLHQHITCSSSS